MAGALSAGCGGGSVSRAGVLAALADEAIIPAYTRMAGSAAGLQRSAEALCDGIAGSGADTGGGAGAEGRLDDARAALADTLSAWSASEAMWVGPTMERRSWAVIDWPVDRLEIEELVSDGEPIDADRLTQRIGADQRGLRAVQYILHSVPGAGAESGALSVGPEAGASAAAESGASAVAGAGVPDPAAAADTARDGRVLASLRDPRRCDYLTGITAAISAEAEALRLDWIESWEGGPAYREVLAASGDSSEAIDRLVNDSLFLLEAIADRELGAAVGMMDDPSAAAADGMGGREKSVALSVTDMRDHFGGLRSVLVGAGPGAGGGDAGQGLGPLLGAELAERLGGLIDAADAALGDLPEWLPSAVEHSPDAVRRARDAVKAVQVAVATEVVSRLGVAVGFSDADGDSSG